MTLRYFSSFTGIGGFDIAAQELRLECVGMSEIDRYANMVLKYRFPQCKNYGDITQIRWDEVPDFDVLLGGTPCQDLSIAGSRKGLRGEKSSIFFEFVRALKEKKPKYFIWENVKGALSTNKGWDFATVLDSFSEAGYSLWWQVLDATWFGIPQHRERVFIVGASGDEPPIKVFFEPKNGRQAPNIQRLSAVIQSKSQIARVYDSSGIAPTLHRHTGGWQVTKIAVPVLTPDRMVKRQNGRRFKEDGEPFFTITATDRHGIFNGFSIRYITPLEAERLMGLPDNWTKYGINDKGEVVELSDSARYNLVGNAVVPQIVKYILEKSLGREKFINLPSS